MNVARANTDVMKGGGAAFTIEAPDGSLVGINEEVFSSVAREISEEEERNIALVTSLGIARGMLAEGINMRPDKETAMTELQRLSVKGWVPLVNDWDRAIGGERAGPIQLTREDLENAVRCAETMKLLYELFRHGDVPVANENDATTHAEITFGSNDILSAIMAAQMQHSGLFGEVRLFMLTDVDGVYEDLEDPSTRIPVIEEVDEYSHLAVESDSVHHIGGMESKFVAVEIAKEAGVPSYIYDPSHGHRQRAVDGEIGTYFPVPA